MKSLSNALTRAGDRRSLTLFRSSGAGALTVFLLTLIAIHPESGGSKAPTDRDLFAMEIGLPQPGITAALTIAPTHEAARAGVAALSAVTKDEFAFSPHYSAEPIGY